MDSINNVCVCVLCAVVISVQVARGQEDKQTNKIIFKSFQPSFNSQVGDISSEMCVYIHLNMSFFA